MGINKASDAIFAASESNQKCGILDNDYKSAFDFMVSKWVIKVLLAKGMDSQVVNRLHSLKNFKTSSKIKKSTKMKTTSKMKTASTMKMIISKH